MKARNIQDMASKGYRRNTSGNPIRLLEYQREYYSYPQMIVHSFFEYDTYLICLLEYQKESYLSPIFLEFSSRNETQRTVQTFFQFESYWIRHPGFFGIATSTKRRNRGRAPHAR